MPLTVSNQAVSPRSGHFGSEASFCQYFYLGAQASGSFEDYKSALGDAPKNTGFADATAWANAGVATTGGTANEFFERGAGTGHAFTLAGYALCFSVTFLKATPGSNEICLESYSAGSPGGLRLTANSAGSIGLAINTVSNVSLSLTITAGFNPLDGNTHQLTWFVPPDPVSARYYLDGLAASSASAATVAGQDCRNSANGMRIGSALASAAAKVARWSRLQQYNVPCATLASINYEAVASYLYRNPGRPVPDFMWGIAA